MLKVVAWLFFMYLAYKFVANSSSNDFDDIEFDE